MNYPNTYDAEIQRRVAQHLPWWRQWQRTKAQLIAESDLNPLAVSETGAEGIAQFEPDDWAEWSAKCGYGPEITAFMAAPAIDVHCAYMAHLYGEWSLPRAEIDRWRLAVASYNAGLGNILKAQSLAGGAPDWLTISSTLSDVTGESNAAQTVEYVARTERVLAELLQCQSSQAS